MELNKIYNESNLETMSRMPDGFVDLTITSPPYNMRLRVRNGEYISRGKGKDFSKKYTHFSDDMPIEVFYENHKVILTELLRVSKIVFYNIQIVTGSKQAFFKLIGDFSEYIKDVIVWHKGDGQPAMHPDVLNASHEFILILEADKKNGRSITNSYFERGKLSNVWYVNNKQQDTEGHGAAFPLKIAEMIVVNFSKTGDLVYDPFGGTGTTAIAAHKNNRKWILSEIIKEYSTAAEKRIAPYLLQLTLF
jgi:site-specific DNA-methyltransferase (adenine-specific)